MIASKEINNARQQATELRHYADSLLPIETNKLLQNGTQKNIKKTLETT